MSRLVDILMEFWDWLMRVFGFRSSAPEGVPEELRRGARASRARCAGSGPDCCFCWSSTSA